MEETKRLQDERGATVDPNGRAARRAASPRAAECPA
jgi:hypothetical protein